jgi:hypothetical protein
LYGGQAGRSEQRQSREARDRWGFDGGSGPGKNPCIIKKTFLELEMSFSLINRRLHYARADLVEEPGDEQAEKRHGSPL